jgi:hypothetical protein
MTVRLKYFLVPAALFLLASGGFGQRKELAAVPWAPPADLDFPRGSVASPTAPQPMIGALRLGTMSIRFDRTEFATVREQMGGEQGQRGDMSAALQWLCYGGQDAGGRWALWLTGGEIDGPTIGSFEWRRVEANAQFDPRCAQLPAGETITLSPTPLRLGMSREEVLRRLGKPTLPRGDILEYDYSGQKKTYVVWNTVAVGLRRGIVDSILGAETISNQPAAGAMLY